MKTSVKTIRNGVFDLLRYKKHSGTVNNLNDDAVLRAHIMMDAHRIEKGLALPVPRPGFGNEVIDRLIVNLQKSSAANGQDFAFRWACDVLHCYVQFNAAHGVSSHAAEEFLRKVSSVSENLGGLIEIEPLLPQGATADAFRKLALTRHSVRQFSDRVVAPELIGRALEIAAKTPSVCNRQSARLHHVTNADLKRRALEVQGGNRGFGDTVPELLIVTSDLRSFLTPAERYQNWIDGGLFAMSLVFALHSLGLGTCMLNWSVDPSRDKALRGVIDLPKYENIIVFIAAGYSKEHALVASSPRMHPSSLLTTH